MRRPPLRKWLRRAFVFVAALLLLVIACAALVWLASERRLRRDYAIVADLRAPDPALREEGRRLARSRGCADCHGDDYGGRVIADAMPFARLVGDALTRRSPAESAATLHARMHRALHHGVDMESRPLLMMPSKQFASLSAHEIEALSAWFASLPPSDRRLPDSALGPLGRALLVAEKLPGFLSAEAIDHDVAAVDKPPPAGTLAQGAHAAQLCTGCHRADFGGGRMSHGGPDLPPASNLTAHASGLLAWSEDDFLAAMRSGRRPDGSAIDARAMPWRAVGAADDVELRALWRYLRTLPPVARDVRASQR